MREDIIFAGFGGQGIMLMGKMLSYAVMNQGKYVTWLPSYGAEVRGGTAHSMVIVSDKQIASPLVRQPSICAVMNKPSFKKFEPRVKAGGILIINTSLIENSTERKDIDVLEIPATDMALKLGSARVANMVVLGAILSKRDILSIDGLVESLRYVIPESRKTMIPLNQEAIRQGYEYSSSKVRT